MFGSGATTLIFSNEEINDISSCSKCKNEDENKFKEEELFKTLKILGLTENI